MTSVKDNEKKVVRDDILINWTSGQAKFYLSSLGNRWLHVQGVVEQAQRVGQVLNDNDRIYLIAGAYMHDIGYAPLLKKTGFHPLDGAIYLYALGQERLASLVAHHSEARFEAQLRGYAQELEAFPHEQSIVADALIYCDMTTGPTGLRLSFKERIDDIFDRYDEKDVVSQAIRQALPTLALAVERTQDMIEKSIP